ncbi:MAG TPA: beta-propeller fold lactonase family protein, partial [Polyangiaceae bacterium]
FLYETQEFLPGIRAFHIGPAGALSELESSPFGETLVRSGALVFAPNGAFLYASGQGLSAFAIDGASGALDAVDGSPFTTDLGSDFFAANIAIDPRGEFLYTTAFTTTRHVSGFSIDAVSGALERVPGSPLTTSAPYSVAVDPAGRFVYVGNDFGDVSVFAINRRNGSLDELDDSPFTPGGPQPGFAFATR